MRTIFNFNANWAFTKENNGVPSSIPAQAEWVNLPHTWNAVDGMDGGSDYHRGTCWYVKNLKREELPKAERYYLEINGANSSADVYLNGEKLAHHDGGYSTWRVDLTEKLGEEALLTIAVDKILASGLNTTMALKGASGAALFTPTLLSDIILSYGGDEGVEGAAVLTLAKDDLKAFAAVRGKNEYLPVYTIVPDTDNPSGGVIKDNHGLSCRYCLNKNVTALSKASLSASPVKTMFYGNPQCAEMGLWGGVEVTVNEGYKFGEGLLTILGEVTADADVTVNKGFVVVTGQTA